MHFNWLMLIGALEGCFNLLTRTEVGWGGVKNVHSELVLSVLMLLLNWNEKPFFELLFSSLYGMKTIKKKIIPCILDSFSMDEISWSTRC